MEAKLVSLVEHYMSLHLHDNALFMADCLMTEAPSETNRHLLASVLIQMGRWKAAQTVLKDTSTPTNRYLYARCCIASDEYQEAEDTLLRAAGMEPGTPMDTIVQTFQRAPFRLPNGAAGAYLLATAALRLGRQEPASKYYMLALYLDPFMYAAFEQLCRMGYFPDPAQSFVELRLGAAGALSDRALANAEEKRRAQVAALQPSSSAGPGQQQQQQQSSGAEAAPPPRTAGVKREAPDADHAPGAPGRGRPGSGSSLPTPAAAAANESTRQQGAAGVPHSGTQPRQGGAPAREPPRGPTRRLVAPSPGLSPITPAGRLLLSSPSLLHSAPGGGEGGPPRGATYTPAAAGGAGGRAGGAPERRSQGQGRLTPIAELTAAAAAAAAAATPAAMGRGEAMLTEEEGEEEAGDEDAMRSGDTSVGGGAGAAAAAGATPPFASASDPSRTAAKPQLRRPPASGEGAGLPEEGVMPRTAAARRRPWDHIVGSGGGAAVVSQRLGFAPGSGALPLSHVHPAFAGSVADHRLAAHWSGVHASSSPAAASSSSSALAMASLSPIPPAYQNDSMRLTSRLLGASLAGHRAGGPPSSAAMMGDAAHDAAVGTAFTTPREAAAAAAARLSAAAGGRTMTAASAVAPTPRPGGASSGVGRRVLPYRLAWSGAGSIVGGGGAGGQPSPDGDPLLQPSTDPRARTLHGLSRPPFSAASQDETGVTPSIDFSTSSSAAAGPAAARGGANVSGAGLPGAADASFLLQQQPGTAAPAHSSGRNLRRRATTRLQFGTPGSGAPTPSIGAASAPIASPPAVQGASGGGEEPASAPRGAAGGIFGPRGPAAGVSSGGGMAGRSPAVGAHSAARARRPGAAEPGGAFASAEEESSNDEAEGEQGSLRGDSPTDLAAQLMRGTLATLELFQQLGFATRHLWKFEGPLAVACLEDTPPPGPASSSTAPHLGRLAAHHAAGGFGRYIAGKAQLDAGNYAAARIAFEAMRRSAPHRVEGLELLSTVLWHLKAVPELTALAADVAAAHPGSWQALCVLGNAHSAQGDHKTAAAMFRRAISLDPWTAVYAYLLCGQEHIALGKYEEAGELLRTGLRKGEPRHYAGWHALGLVYLRTARAEHALYHFKRATDLHRYSPLLHVSYAMALAGENKLPEALTALERALRLDPDHLQALYQRALVYSAMGRHAEARADLQAVNARAPREPAVLVQLGKECKRVGRLVDAVLCWNKALLLARADKEANVIKSLLASVGGSSEAEDVLQV